MVGRVLLNRGSEKVLNFNKWGVRIIVGGSEFEKGLKMIIKRGKKQKQVVNFAVCHCSSILLAKFLRSSMPENIIIKVVLTKVN